MAELPKIDSQQNNIPDEIKDMVKQLYEENQKLKEALKGKRSEDEMIKWRKAKRVYGYLPDNQFAHSMLLLKPLPETIEDFNQLLNQNLLLGDISDNRLLRLYQNDIMWVVNFFSMAKNGGKTGEAIKMVFDALYWNLVMEIRMTAIKGGKERYLQSFAHFRTEGFAPPWEEKEPTTLEKILGKRSGNQRPPFGGGNIYE